MKGRVAAIGTFDGVHRGHRSVLAALIEYGKENGLDPMVITFNRHPLSVIDPSRTPADLTPLWKKKKLLEEVGVTPMVLEFDTQLRSTTAYQWMKKLHDEHHVRAMVIGYDNTFGHDGVNLSLEDYKTIGQNIGIDVVTADEVKGVSSSAIRKSVLAGDMESAHKMLGRPYSITAQVVKGNRLGHTLGFPTANIRLPERVAVPKPGVYAAIVKTLENGEKHLAMVNVGYRPTVMRGDDLVMEAHIIDWSGDLYDKNITVRFIKRIRDEKKFDSIEALRKQLESDRSEALRILHSQVSTSKALK